MFAATTGLSLSPKRCANGSPMSKLKHARENPYDTLAQFRIEAVDGNGVEWTGRYTHPYRIDVALRMVATGAQPL